MDIKDFILIGGGLLIAAVVAHGFWIAWRARREPMRLDIVPNMFPEDVDDIEWLRGELPNGGGRVIAPTSGEQEKLDLENSAPLLLEPTQVGAPTRGAVEPSVGAPEAPQGRDPTSQAPDPELADEQQIHEQDDEAARANVAAVEIPEAPPEPQAAVEGPPRQPRRLAAKPKAEPALPAEPPSVEELLILNVLARPSTRFSGAELFAALRSRGLKFGNMNIFHCTDPLTKMVQYSVANVVEPGTFDMADMDEFRSPGLCFFMQLPGPEHPGQALEDMFKVAMSVSTELRGELKDEQHNLITPQMVEHYRQRIMDYTRRHMSKRA